MILNIILLIIGFIVLIKGADFFVDGSSSLARNFKISPIIIGLTIVSFGTSAPEFAVSIQSLLKGSGDIVLGNVIGSNIINILLIIGISSVIHPLIVRNSTVKKELPITILITTLLIVLMNDFIFQGTKNSFSRQDGITLCMFFLIFIYYLIQMIRKGHEENEEQEIKYSISKSVLYGLTGLVGIVIGSKFVVDSASYIALAIGVSERMVALTVVALGTSLPELVTSVVATRKKEYDIAIGNVVGSNIFNIGIVLGIPTMIFGGIENITFSIIDLLVMFISSLMLFAFSYKDKKIDRKEGIAMLILFVIYYSYVIFYK